jgi:hypothetical protein
MLMSVYGDERKLFDRLGRSGLLLVATSALLIGVQLGRITLAASWSLAADLRTVAGQVPFFAPPAADPLPAPLAIALDPMRRAAGPVACLLLAALLIFVWPTGRTLSGVVSMHLVAAGMTIAAMAAALDLPPHQWLPLELTVSGLWRPLVLLAALVLLQQNERRLNEILGSISRATTPLQRASLWALRMPLAAALLALFAVAAGYLAQLTAVVIAVVLTLVASLAIRPRGGRFHDVGDPTMREAAIGAPLIAIILLGGAAWLFGVPRLTDEHLLLVSSRAVERRPLASVSLHTPAEIALKEEEARRERSVIDIQWSREKQPE